DILSLIPSSSIPPFLFPLLLFFQLYLDHRSLHSFPTRRSSDLSSVPSLMAKRNISPVEICGILYFSFIFSACVPFPAPGRPIKIKFTAILLSFLIGFVYLINPVYWHFTNLLSSFFIVCRATPTTLS